MSRRWQSDDIPFWRKLFSSNWWWYGEINPDQTSLPPLEKRPKFWRGDVIAMALLLIAFPVLVHLQTTLNARYWFFNKTNIYVGQVVEATYNYPQFEVRLEDQTLVRMAFPMEDMFGLPRKDHSINRWTPFVDELMQRQRQCPGQLLEFDAEFWKFTFRPFLIIWEVRCTSGYVVVSKNQINSIWKAHAEWARSVFYFFVGILLIFSVVLIIRRERKRYVKS
jgi:hypothetical protein